MLSLVMFLLFGLIVGAVARFLMPGHERGGWGFSILLGIAGAFVGGFLGRAAGLYRYDQPAGFIMSVIGAMILVGIYHAVRGHSYA
jgi:uncharacterized membrane protein YeaQ/YmgE (transglycosylase-associated protein family)